MAAPCVPSRHAWAVQRYAYHPSCYHSTTLTPTITDSRAIYVLLLTYAASAVTTTLPCLTTILATPVTAVASTNPASVSVTPEQRTMLLTSYVPFLVVPLLMTIDMGFRVLSLVRAGSAAAERQKRK